MLSAKAEYACVAMMELAARYGSGRPTRVNEIAERHGISDRFLVQILLALKHAGFVESTRGASGGYQLCRPPESITLYDILRVTDPPAADAEDTRILHSPYFPQLQQVWSKIREAQDQVLKQTTLAELLARSEGLQYVI